MTHGILTLIISNPPSISRVTPNLSSFTSTFDANVAYNDSNNFIVILGAVAVISSSNLWSMDGAVVRALASHQCGLGLIPGLGIICGLSLLLVLIPAPRVFLRALRFPSLHKNQHFQIPIQPRNSGEKSHSMDSTEMPLLLLLLG